MKRCRVMSSSYNLERWDSRAEWPLAGVAVVFLVLYSVQVLARPPGRIHSLLLDRYGHLYDSAVEAVGVAINDLLTQKCRQNVGTDGNPTPKLRAVNSA
jgi:hypothetical protein